MEKKITPIKQIKEGSRKWTAKGTCTQLSLFGDSIEKFKDSFIIDKSYYISNAHVKKLELKFKMVESKYEWILNRRTVVEEVKQEDKDVFSPPVAFSFIPFSGLQQYIESHGQVEMNSRERS
ncbi:hypothetical protein CsatB_029126 [Cannabis sativa]